MTDAPPRRGSLLRCAAVLGVVTLAASLHTLPAANALGATAAPALLATGPETSRAEPSRPNVLVYVTDDQRAAGTMEVMPKTEAIFGAGGRRFSRGMVTTPLCGPSRVSFMTGRYTHNHGVSCNGPRQLVLNLDQATTLQHHLQGAGYRTALVGKYLNLWPLDRNPPRFDRWSMTVGGVYNDPMVNRNGVVTKVPGYSTDILADEAVRYLQEFQSDDSRPWMMLVTPTGAHAPYFPGPRYRDAPVPAWEPPPSATETDLSDKPPLLREQVPDLAESADVRAKQLRTLMSVDDLVGRVDAEMTRLGERNTLSFFSSDNGYLWGDHHVVANKRLPYEPAQRVPLYVRWPGRVPAGSVDHRLAANIDVVPTVLEAAGARPQLTAPIDGRSLLGTYRRPRLHLEYYKSTIEDGGGLNEAVGTWASTRGQNFQYTEWYNDNGGIVFREYYDLTRDPYQLSNLLGDRVTANDPDLAPLHDLLVRDHACSGAACP